MRFLDYYPAFQNAFKKHEFLAYANQPTKFISHEDTHNVVDIKVLEKGCLIYVKDEKYPLRAIMLREKVGDLAKTKKMIPLFANFAISNGIVGVIGAIKYWKLILDIAYWQLGDLYIEPNKYSQPVREVYRVIKNEKIRNILCSILEFDIAYRFRFQDIIGELDKGLFLDNPVKEIKRLWNMALEREQSGAIDKFKLFMPIFLTYLRHRKKVIKELKEIIKEVDIDEIKLSIEDIYWSNKNFSYDFRGLTFKQRLEQNETL